MKKYYSLILRLVLVFLLVLVAYVANAFAQPIPKEVEPLSQVEPLYGVSYSFEHAEWYGMDSRKSYVEMLDEIKPDWVRLSFFWDRHTKADGSLNLEEIEFAIGEAGKRNVKVVIALGAKTPYHPEYHLPDQIKPQLKFGDTIDKGHPIADDILAIDRKVVEKLSAYDNISHWQVENEPFLANINNWKFDQDFLEQEVETVRSADPAKRPIMLTTASHPSFDKRYKGLLEILQPGDVLGTSAYFKIEGVHLFAFSLFSNEIVVPWPDWLVWPVHSWLFLSPDYSAIQKEASEKGIEFWVEEMQAEPYIRSLEYARGNDLSFSPDDLKKADKFIRADGVSSIGLWGASFWQFRESVGDESWIQTVGEITGY